MTVETEPRTGSRTDTARSADCLVDALRTRGARTSVAAGQVIFTEGQSDARVFLVVSGSIDIGLGSRDGQRLTLNVLREGDVFGEVAMLDGGPRTADAVARIDSRVASLDKRQFLSLFASERDAHEFIVTLLCQRLRWINRHTEHIPLCTARTLLASRLLMLGNGKRADWIDTSQQEMADRAGITREWANRLLKEWSKAGIIERKRGAIRVLQWDILSELTDVRS